MSADVHRRAAVGELVVREQEIMNWITNTLLIVVGVYVLGEAVFLGLRQLGRIDERLSPRFRAVAASTIGVAGIVLIAWLVITHDYSGLLR